MIFYGITSVVLLLVFPKQGVHACFTYNKKNIETYVKTESSFYQECHCTEQGYTIDNLKWLDNNNQEIDMLRPGIMANVYTERKNGALSLNIPSMSKTLGGTYKCVTTNNGKEYVQSFDVVVYDPINFIETNEEQFIVKGKDAIVTCQVQSDIESIVSWHLGPDEQLLTDSEKYEIIKFRGLKIKNVTDSDQGTYKCSALTMKTAGYYDRNIAVVVVTEPLIEQLKVEPNKTVIAGDSLSVECIASGYPSPNILWNKISKSPKPRDANVSWYQINNLLKFDNITPDDQGTYGCVASNKAGSNTQEIFIEVLYGPTITSFDDLKVVENTTVNIICKAKGKPLPDINIAHYENDNETVDEERSVWRIHKENDIETINVTISKITRADAGTYVCNASNEVDVDSKAIEVSVLHQPYFKTPDEFIWAWEGKTINLSCEIDSYPIATMVWSLPTNPLATPEQKEFMKLLREKLITTPNYNCEINVTEHFIYGEFGCLAQNDYGSATKRILVYQGFPPSAVTNVTVIIETARSFTFEIEKPIHFDGPSISGYTADYEESSKYNLSDAHKSRTWSIDRPLRVEKLSPNTSYYFKFAAINEVGIGNWSEVYEFETPEKSVPERPSWNYPNTVEEISGHRILRWIEPESNGDPIDYYGVEYCKLPTCEKKEEEEVSGKASKCISPMHFEAQTEMNNSVILLDECNDTIVEPNTELLLDFLDDPHTRYHLKLFAHNSEGNSPTIDIYIDGWKPVAEPEKSLLSAAAVIGISVVIAVLCLMILELILLCCFRKGIIASCCLKKKNEERKLSTRDRKGLLPHNGESSAEDTLKKPNNRHKEFEYNKTTGIITGKNSAV